MATLAVKWRARVGKLELESSNVHLAQTSRYDGDHDGDQSGDGADIDVRELSEPWPRAALRHCPAPAREPNFVYANA
jgi:hypothetical protein